MIRIIKIVYYFIKYVIRTKKWDLSDRIISPLSIEGIKNIQMGHNVLIKDNAYIIVQPFTGEDTCQFIMGDNSHLNFGSHIVATKSIIIGKNCNCAPNVYIADNTHGYEDISIAPKFQNIKQLKEVVIGDDTWLGRNVCVIGCSVGKHCVIGSNSVVNHDIPDYSIAAGAPARIIKRYDFEMGKWRKTDPKGVFID